MHHNLRIKEDNSLKNGSLSTQNVKKKTSQDAPAIVCLFESFIIETSNIYNYDIAYNIIS